MSVELFKGQDYRLILDTGIDLAGATVLKILYTKPFGEKGEWGATADVQNIYYDIPASENNLSGVWSFQSYVEQGGKKFYGGIVKKIIFNNIK